MMKTAVFALLLLLSLNQGEALRCNICAGRGRGLCNPVVSVTCPPNLNACAAVTTRLFRRRRSFRSCLDLIVCLGLKLIPGTRARCCTNELCN